MNRGYTREHYLDMIERARRIVPGIEIASDFIVGFPGETDDEFQQTVDLVRTARFNQCFIFKYSPRPYTRAAQLNDDVFVDVKKRRNNELLSVQEEVSAERNWHTHGHILEILVEGTSKSDPSKLTGRTRGYDIVVAPGPHTVEGSIVPVRIVDSTPLTLFGEIQQLDQLSAAG
jgi:tRNA-2-methylthio-N6-dimethylallyladenosine synthase